MSDSESSLPEFSDDEIIDDVFKPEDEGKKSKKKKEKVKVDPPLMNRPTTPDDFERLEPTPYEVFISATDLPNADGFRSLSDPRCIMYMKAGFLMKILLTKKI